MDLPSAADKIIQHLEMLISNTADISVRLDEVVKLAIQPLYERINQLEAEISGKDFRGCHPQEEQEYCAQSDPQAENEFDGLKFDEDTASDLDIESKDL